LRRESRPHRKPYSPKPDGCSCERSGPSVVDATYGELSIFSAE
jgi:hypothetical protein